MARNKAMRLFAFRVAGAATVLALASLAIVVSPAAAVGVKSTTTTVTGTTPDYTGAPTVFTATVEHNSLTPTGTVTFTITGADASTPVCDGGTNTITLAPATTGSSAQCSINGGLLAAGSPYSVTAVYSGDPNFTTSTGTLSQVITKGSTTTSVTSASDPSVTGQPVSFTAVVAPVNPSTGVPTGSVTFSISGLGGTSVPCDAGDTQTLDGTGTAQCSVAAGLLSADNPYTVNAVYSADHNYKTSTGSATQTVYKATATIGVTSSASPLVTGQPVAFTATITGVTPPGMGTPAGSIVFSIVGNNVTPPVCQGGDTVPLSGSTAVCNFPTGLPAKSLNYTISATLQDPNFKSPVAGTLVEAVQRASSEVLLGGLPGSLVASQGFSFDATIKTEAPGTGAPTGYFEWSVCPDNPQGVCTPGPDGNGTIGGTYPLPTPTANQISKNRNVVWVSAPEGLRPGFYDVQATYEGDFNISGNTSATGHILVTQVPTSLVVDPSHDPIANGGRLKIRVGVIPDARASDSLGAPSGTLTYTITGNSGDTLNCSNGTDNVITISTDSKNQGVGKCVIPPDELMATDTPYTVTVAYSGDSNYAASPGSAVEHVDPASGG